MRGNTKAVSVCAAATAAALFASYVSAAEIQWKGGTGVISAANYTSNGTNSVAPTTSDFINVGAGGTVTVAASYNVPGRARIGHNFSFTSPSFAGAGTVNISTGTLSFGGNSSAGFQNAGLVVGYNADGTINFTGGIINVTQSAFIGVNDPAVNGGGSGTGTLTQTSGSFRVQRNDLYIGYGNPGVVNIGAGAQFEIFPQGTQSERPDMYVGFSSPSQLTKNGPGNLSVANNLLIGSGSTVSLSAGTTTTKFKTDSPAGNIAVGRQGSTGDTLNISGSAVVNIGNRFLLGSGGTGGINSLVDQTAGTVTTALNLAVSDTGGNSTYKLSGGSTTFNSQLSRVGRRGSGTMLQSGGTATFNAGLAIGDDDSANTVEAANGVYEISGGELHATLAGNALSVGSAGNGTFRVVGDDGLIDVNGNMLVGNTSGGVGGLAYKFESGDLLSVIDVSGTTTFADGTSVTFDTSAASPTQRVYDIMTAASVVDSGVSSPGWALGSIAGGNGRIVQAGTLGTLYWDIDGVTAGAGGATPSGAWDGSATNFTADPAGASATSAATIFADDVVFTAGSDGTGAYAVTVSGTQAAHSIQVPRGDLTLTGGSLAVGIVDVSSGASASISSVMVGGGAGSNLTKTGPGTLTLAAANTHTGFTRSVAGTLIVGDSLALQNSTLDMNGADAGAVTFSVTSATLGGLSGSRDLAMPATSLSVGNNNASTTYSGQLSGAGSALIKVGTGTLTLSGANSYTGGTTVSGGTLKGSTTSLQGDIVNNASVVFDQATSGSYGGTMSGTGSLTKSGAGAVTLAAANSYGGTTTVSAGTLAYGVNDALPSGAGKGNVSVAGTLDLAGFSGTINGLSGAGTVTSSTTASTLTVGANDQTSTFTGTATGALALTKTGTGTLTLSGANSYTGDTSVAAGTLKYGAANTVPNGAGKGNVSVAGTLDLAGFNGTVNGLSGAGTITDSAAGASTLTVGANDAAGNFTGTAQNGTGTLAVVKTGTGTVAMTGTNTFTGGTTVNGGKLQVSRMQESNAVTIAAGASLQVVDSSPTLPSTPSGNNAFVSRPSSLSIANDGAPIGTPRVYTATLDLGNNDLILDYTGAGDNPVVATEDAVRSGYNGGAWTGTGITSSTAANVLANGNFALAVADNALLTNKFGDGTGGKPQFSGQNVDDTTVLVKFTHRVDLDLDGFVTPNDAIIFATNYIQNGAGNWITGDVDYDGLHTQNDAIIFATFYNGTLPSLPEPGIATVGLGAAGLLLRRSRRA